MHLLYLSPFRVLRFAPLLKRRRRLSAYFCSLCPAAADEAREQRASSVVPLALGVGVVVVYSEALECQSIKTVRHERAFISYLLR